MREEKKSAKKMSRPGLNNWLFSAFRLLGWGLFGAIVLSAQGVANNADPNAVFTVVNTSDSSSITPRHENGSLEFAGKLYVIGGRSQRPIESYDPVTNSWTNHGFAPFEINHFQPVAWQGKFYIIGAFDCCYPEESVVAQIQIFDPFTEIWSSGPDIPASRLRGSAGAAVYNDKIYLLGGNTQGHSGGAVAWFDEYDPATNTWKEMPDAPSARDHFSLVLAGDKLIAAGGRRSTQPNPFTNLVSSVDVFNFSTGQWETGNDDIPTPRAGAMAVVLGDEGILIGGETDADPLANVEVEAFDVTSGTWRPLQPLITGTHTGAAAMLGQYLHVVSGSNTQGGGGENDLHVRAQIDTGDSDTQDTDADGLSDYAEVNTHSTDPTRKDTDNDGIEDADELNLQTDPTDADSDNDNLSDGDELYVHNTNPLNADTDADTLTDDIEISAGLNPNKADSDTDGLDDAYEQNISNTNPLLTDSDQDGVLDGDEVNIHGSDPNKKDTDADGLSDAEEVAAGSSPLLSDTDEDGVSDVSEVKVYFSNPAKSDTDGDLLDDNREVNETYTSPVKADSDDDGLDDGLEVDTWKTDPKNPDTDNDGLSDGDEVNTYGSDPLSRDSDNDGTPDGAEVAAGLDPSKAGDHGDDALNGGDTDDSNSSGGSGGGGAFGFLGLCILLSRRSAWLHSQTHSAPLT